VAQYGVLIVFFFIVNSECVSSASNRFVLLSWVNVLVNAVLDTTGSENALKSPLFSAILNAQGILIDSLADDSKKSISKSAIADVRRTIRRNAASIPVLIDCALANAQTCTPSFKNAVLIGTIVDCSLRLKTRNDGKDMVLKAEDKLRDYYLKNIISSRTAVHQVALKSFNDFIRETVTKEKFSNDYLPALDKMMLRSPEIVLQGTIDLLLIKMDLYSLILFFAYG
jgi:hypothetical protein